MIEFSRLRCAFNFATAGAEKREGNRDNECGDERAAQRARRKRERERESEGRVGESETSIVSAAKKL